MTSDTSSILTQAQRWQEEGRPVALATVLETWGSAPRAAGSHMAICGDGDFVGSVSGGCVETAVVEESRKVLSGGVATTLEYGITDDDAWAVGLACGGRVRVYVEPVGPLTSLTEALAAHRPVVRALRLSDGADALLRPLGADPAVGGEWPESESRQALLEDRARVVPTDNGHVFLRPYNPPVRVFVVGAVHVSQALVPMISAAGFRPLVIDPRTAFATAARFPGVELVHRWPAEVLRDSALDHRSAVVALTHDPKFDDDALVAALNSPAFYVGALGSRRTHAKRVTRLEEAGIDPDRIDAIHAPIGLDIGARTPQEIAVSIVAEIIASLRVVPAKA